MAKLKKYKPLSPAALLDLKKALEESNGEEVAVGNIYIRNNYSGDTKICKITEINEGVSHLEENDKPIAVIVFDIADDWEGKDWHYGGEENADIFFNEDTYLIKGTISEWMEKAALMLDKKDYTALIDTTGEIKETALVSPNSKPQLLALKGEMELKRNQVGLLRSFVEMEIARRNQALKEVEEKLGEILEVFRDKIKKIHRLISVIELYLGVHEKIIQISQGKKASPTSPISFRQQLLFMDEEVGEPSDGGWDWERIEDFDAWLIKDAKFKTLCPEEKCIVVFRPRRGSKYYSEDPILQFFLDSNNHKTYFLIRNGDCVFRIWADISIGDRLFPLRKEFEKILKEIHNYEQKGKSWNKDEIEQLENKMHGYKERAFMLQGLIDRTEIFHPIAKPVSMFDMEAAGGLIQFIYDDELALPTGQLSFWEWWGTINSKIQRGSRVIHSGQYTDDGSYADSDNYYQHWFKRYKERKCPKLPNEGLYIVDSIIEEKTDDLPYYYADMLERKGMMIKRGEKKNPEDSYEEGYESYNGNNYLPENPKMKLITHKRKSFIGETQRYIDTYECTFKHEIFFISYNPKDRVSYKWGDFTHHTRKNNLRFKIKPQGDRYIFNYDQISLADIDFYLSSRIDRREYAYMMPILRTWKKHRLEELKWEKEFVEFVKRRVKQKKLTPKVNVDLDKIIWAAIDWWKHKNIWKRPITKDDTLALRMIERRIFSQKSIKQNFITG